MDIMHFFSFWPEATRNRRGPIRQYGGYQFVPLAIVLYDTGLVQSSQLHRLAVLAFMSYFKTKKSNVQTFEYLSRFYQQLLKGSSARSTLEVVYAWYVVAIYTIMDGESIDVAIDHCHQFCRAFVSLRLSSWDDDELMYLETLWREMLDSLYYQHRDGIRLGDLTEPTDLTDLQLSTQKIHDMLQMSSAILPSQRRILRFNPTSREWICQNIVTLLIYLQYYFDHFLFRLNYTSKESESLRTALRDILDRLLPLYAQLPDIQAYVDGAYSMPFDGDEYDFLSFLPVPPQRAVKTFDRKARDTCAAFAYVFARMLRNMLDTNVNGNKNISDEIYRSALALCRLCATIPSRDSYPERYNVIVWMTHRTLFWAGMVLTRSRFPAGKISSLFPFANMCSSRMDQGTLERMHQ